MVRCNLIVDGRAEADMTLPTIPNRGDVLSYVDPKLPVYLVQRVEMVDGYEDPNLHVQKFANKLDAMRHIDGFGALAHR